MRDGEKKARENIRAAYKSSETEEWFDTVFTKPVGYVFTRLFLHLKWTPNAVTVLSMCIGFAGGWMMLPENLWWNLGGILLVIFADILDSTDGQMARLTHQTSTIGRILDGLSSYVWYMGIYLALGIRLMDDPVPFLPGCVWGGWIWLVVVISGVLGHGVQSLLADYYRNAHLFFLKDKSGSELTSSADVRRQRDAAKGAERVFLAFYYLYTRVQELLTPQTQKLFACIGAWGVSAEMKEAYLNESRRRIWMTNVLTFNARAYTLFALVLLGVPVYYFVFEIFVLGALLLVMRGRYETLAETLCKKNGTA